MHQDVMPRVAAIGVALALAVGLASCSSDDDSTGTSAPAPAEQADDATASGDLSDPCTLLTTSQIDAATGSSFGDATPNEDLSGPGRAVCDWTAEGDGFALVQVLVQAADTFDANQASVEEVTGLGAAPDISGADAAYITSEGSIVGMRLGGQFVQVSYIPAGPGEVTQATTQLAQDAADAA